jgi:L-alanine-DL-glutamate epimerase-like enolase superfamily enzyme
MVCVQLAAYGAVRAAGSPVATFYHSAALGSVVAEVEADDGTIGIGITIGGEPAAFIIENHLSRFVEGEDPRNVESMWDQMFR